MRIQCLKKPEDLRPFAGASLYQGFDARWLDIDACDEHLFVTGDDGPVARASLWWRETPALGSEKVGTIGHYRARDAEVARALLDAACAHLAEHGCAVAIAPMDGNTWRKYRFVTDPGTQPPFLMEPENPPEYPCHVMGAGFDVLATYSSALDSDLTLRDPRVERVRRRLAGSGVTWRTMDLKRAEEELGRVHRVALSAFTANLLYTPMPLEAFVEQYRPVVPRLIPGLVWIAECDDEPVGFLFALPDLSQAARGQAVDRAIIKTVAVMPGRRFAGLGALLVEEARSAAWELGFRQAIHALMHDSNESRALSDRFAIPMRRYALYSRRLGA